MRDWRGICFCLTQSFTMTIPGKLLQNSVGISCDHKHQADIFVCFDFFLSECLGATLWHICPDCSSVLSTSVVFRSWGLNGSGRRGWTLLFPIQQSQEICLTLFTEREKDRALYSFLCLLKAHLFEEWESDQGLLWEFSLSVIGLHYMNLFVNVEVFCTVYEL